MISNATREQRKIIAGHLRSFRRTHGRMRMVSNTGTEGSILVGVYARNHSAMVALKVKKDGEWTILGEVGKYLRI